MRTHIYLVAMESVVLSAHPSSMNVGCILCCICSQTLTEKHLILDFCEDELVKSQEICITSDFPVCGTGDQT